MLDDFEDVERLDGARVAEGATRRDRAGRRPRPAWRCASTSTSASGGGFVIVRKAFALTLPANYAFTFELRGEAPPNNFEFKLVDPTGKNVWWRVQRDFAFPTDWQQRDDPQVAPRVRVGRAGGAEAGRRDRDRDLGAATAARARSGSTTSQFEEREPAEPVPASAPKVRGVDARCPGTSRSGCSTTSRRPAGRAARSPREQWLLLDFGAARVRRPASSTGTPSDYATAYRVEVSDDGEQLDARLRRRAAGNGGRDYVYLPDGESRYVRLGARSRAAAARATASARSSVKPLEFSARRTSSSRRSPRSRRRGTYPEVLLRQADVLDGRRRRRRRARKRCSTRRACSRSSKGGFSIEPFLYVDGKLVTWSDVAADAGARATATCRSRRSRWQRRRRRAARRPRSPPASRARRRSTRATGVENRRDRAARRRPLPRDPAVPGRAAVAVAQHGRRRDADPRRSASTAGAVWVNGDKPVDLADAARSLRRRDLRGTGSLTDFLKDGEVPPQTAVADRFGFASGALALRPDARRRRAGGGRRRGAVPRPATTFVAAGAATPCPRCATERAERAPRLGASGSGASSFELPPDARAHRRARSRARSPTSSSIATGRRSSPARAPTRARGSATARSPRRRCSQMGFTEEVRELPRAGTRRTSCRTARIPCCVDRRGADPVPEHDSNGEFIYAVAEYYRFTRDVGFVARDVAAASCARSTTSTACARQRTTDAVPGARTRSRSTACCPSRSATRATRRTRCTRTGTTSSRCAALKDAADARRRHGRRRARATSFADAARRVPRRPLRLDRAHDGDARASTTCPARSSSATSIRRSTAIAVDPGGELANLPRRGARPHLRALLEEFRKRARRRRELGRATRPTSCATSTRSSGSASATRALRAPRLHARAISGRRRGTSGRRSSGATRRRRASSATCRTPGSGRASSARCAPCFAYEREEDQALVLAAGVPAAWVADGKRVGGDAPADVLRRAELQRSRAWRRTWCACSSPATSACRRANLVAAPAARAAAAGGARERQADSDVHRRRGGRQRAAGDGRVRFVSAAGDADAHKHRRRPPSVPRRRPRRRPPRASGGADGAARTSKPFRPSSRCGRERQPVLVEEMECARRRTRARSAVPGWARAWRADGGSDGRHPAGAWPPSVARRRASRGREPPCARRARGAMPRRSGAES